jgi:hypothetical protein
MKRLVDALLWTASVLMLVALVILASVASEVV